MAAQAARYHRPWFDEYRELYRPETAALIEEGLQVSEADEGEGRAGREGLRTELEAQMGEHGLDCWIAPSAPGPAPEGIAATGSGLMNLPWAHAGLPTIGIPAGTASNGLPLGLQCIGRYHRDEDLLATAMWVEAILNSAGATP
jgi:Asp-tRNA(Asn)/Glu-tRNA(Gln) amidotransferase A subunit family amidase